MWDVAVRPGAQGTSVFSPLQVFERAEVGKALNIHITLTNTLTVPLSNCTMVLEGSGIINGQITKG